MTAAMATKPQVPQIGEVWRTHLELDPDLRCIGDVRFTDLRSPVLMTECDRCGYELGVPRKSYAAELERREHPPERPDKWWDR